ncbi:MAG: P1 family peptidase [Gammaproteobacteria bacterium]|jgi:D-aminopeptidase|nr:P1 family peptidase [Gammaproteobacteria bacterium]
MSDSNKQNPVRARDLGLLFNGKPGQWNSITDIPGVEVGFTTMIEGEGEVSVGKGPIRTGVTAVLPRGKEQEANVVWAGQYNLNGFGEMTGTHWINEAGYFLGPVCLTNTHSVGMVHHATVGWMVENYHKQMVNGHEWPLPVVAETYDGMLNDACGRHINENHVLNAINSAKGGSVEEGNVGGGTGMMTYEFKGGTGTASRLVKIDKSEYVVASLVQSNFGLRSELSILGVPVGKHLTENAFVSEMIGHEQGSIIVIIGTNIPMLPIQLHRMAKRAAIGLGRTGTTGGQYSGDIFLAFSTANKQQFTGMQDVQPVCYDMKFLNNHHLDKAFEATVEVIEEAIINAMIAAKSMTTIKPAGYTLDAIDHEKLVKVMSKYGRIQSK